MKQPDYLGRSRKGHEPDYLGRKTGKADWRDHESTVEKRSGGQRRAASGAAPGKPADTKDQDFLRECKATRGAGMSVNGGWLKKIASEALALGKIPLVELRFEGQEEPTPKDWVMIPATDFEAMRERLT